jgi:hypothetical protein
VTSIVIIVIVILKKPLAWNALYNAISNIIRVSAADTKETKWNVFDRIEHRINVCNMDCHHYIIIIIYDICTSRITRKNNVRNRINTPLPCRYSITKYIYPYKMGIMDSIRSYWFSSLDLHVIFIVFWSLDETFLWTFAVRAYIDDIIYYVLLYHCGSTNLL